LLNRLFPQVERIVTKKLLVGWKPRNTERRVASIRIRCLNVIAELRKQHFPIELYKPGKQGYSVVIFSKSYKPRDFETVAALRAAGTRVIFDLCDNHFLKEEERVERLRRMLQICDHCVVSSDAMQSLILEQMGEGYETPVSVIADPVETRLTGSWFNLKARIRAEWQLARLKSRLKGIEEGSFRFVWFGNYKGFQNIGPEHAAMLRQRLEVLHEASPVSLTIISNSHAMFEAIFSDWLIPVHYTDWSAYTFFRAMRLHKVSLIPIELNEFTRVKTNNRVVQSLYLGLGVVADAIDSYREFDGCTFLDKWDEGLRSYVENPALLQAHIREGQEIIKQNYSVTAIAQQWRDLFIRVT
jgi:hypothetical protein